MWKRFKTKQAPQAQRSISEPDGIPLHISEDGGSLARPASSATLEPDAARRGSTGTILPYRDPSSLSALRRTSDNSTLSSFQRHNTYATSPPSSSARPTTQHRQDDPMGLTVLHRPEHGPHTVDIVLIHGLGGSSLCTWCKNRDLNYLWPVHWLPEEPELSTARILTFGYHSQYAETKEASNLSINEFARDLLFRMKFADDQEDEMGKVPIIIIAHSMGGLVFKRAYIHGHHGDEYTQIADSIKAVLFLATPHRGTALADTLKRILSSSPFGHTSKSYVEELARNSPTIDELNESFRHFASKLQIFSFYETLATAFGPVKIRVLDKETSLLGYPNETPQLLLADHHDACKFNNREDPNYKSVLGALRSIVSKLVQGKSSGTAIDAHNEVDQLEALRAWLDVSGPPDDDMVVLRSVRKSGTCENIIHQPAVERWLSSAGPQVLWAHAPPGNGKSVKCSFIIDSLKEEGAKCAYWFYKFDDNHKRSLANMLRSLAYQTAALDPGYRIALVKQSKSCAKISKSDPTSVWRMLFDTAHSTIRSEICWIIDGLDESESPKAVLDLLSNIGKFQNTFRVLIAGRPLSNILQYVQRAKKKVRVTEFELSENLDDIRLVAEDELDELLCTEEFKQKIIDQVTARSQGNFVWATLVLEKIILCHRPDDIQRVMDTTPDGMDRLYQRMVNSIVELTSDEDKHLCKIILSWAMYSKRPISVEELRGLYAAEFNRVFNIEHAINQVCGQFVVIVEHKHVALVHHTAREYLRACSDLPFTLDSFDINEDLLLQCIATLRDPHLRRKIIQHKTSPFLRYASVSWAFHLDRAAAESDTVLKVLVEFFNSPYTLAWIQYLALNDLLSELVAVSTSLSTFVRRRKKADDVKPPNLRHQEEITVLEIWALDLLKMTAKFGSHLVKSPDIIYKYIPPLSPKSSMLYQKHADRQSALTVTGLSATDWDDCLARVSHGTGRALHIAVSGQYLAVANDAPNGNVQLWNNILFQPNSDFDTREPISLLSFSPSGILLACYCRDHTFLWNISDGTVVAEIINPERERAKAMEFAPDETFLIIATDLRAVYRMNLTDTSFAWVKMDSSLLKETSLPEGSFINSPSSVAFNQDCTQLAVAYKGFPLAIWNLDPPEMIARHRRRSKHSSTGTSASWIGVNRVVWHPYNGQVLGINRDLNIFKWNPIDDKYDEIRQELEDTPSEIVCSRTGLVFATSDVKGTIKIYDFAHLTPIYKLSSDDSVSEIVFSPDSRRFYDIRGTYCNVWEPNCLTRLVTTGFDAVDDMESITSSDWDRRPSITSEAEEISSLSAIPASEAHADSKPTIIAVATCVGNKHVFAYANEDGTVELYDRTTDQKHTVANSRFGMRVVHLTLSNRGDFFAYTNLRGTVTVKSLDMGASEEKDLSKIIFEEKKSTVCGTIRQILLNNESTRILVCGDKKMQVVDLTNRTTIATQDVTADARVIFHNDAKNSKSLLAISAESVSTLSWDDLVPGPALPVMMHSPFEQPSPAQGALMEVLLQSYHSNLHLAIITTEDDTGQIVLLDTSNAQGVSSATEGTVTQIPVPANIIEKINVPIGLLSDGRLVFLDDDLWIWTARLRSPTAGFDSALSQHFFVPRDWLNSAGLLLCRLLPDGAFLCPSKGEMAVIDSDLAERGKD